MSFIISNKNEHINKSGFSNTKTPNSPTQNNQNIWDNSINQTQSDLIIGSEKIDFSHHFEQTHKDIVYPITLNDNEKKALLEKINNFEAHLKKLNPTQLEEFIKNKSYNLDFTLKSYGYDNYKNFDDFLNFYKNLQTKLTNGENIKITNEELAQIINYIDISDTVCDGKLGSSTQGMLGDCWALSQFSTYASTKEGAEHIKKRITYDPKNNYYSVQLNNPFNPNEEEIYIITPKELKNFGIHADTNKAGAFSAGDIDTRLLEIATNQMLFKHYKKENTTFDNKPNHFKITGGTPEKYILLHRALGFKGPITVHQKHLPDPNSNDKGNWARIYAPDIYDPNADKNTIYTLVFDIDKNGNLITTAKKEILPHGFNDVIKNNKYTADTLTANTRTVPQNTNTQTLSKEDRYLQDGHVFNISKIKENGDIVLQDPFISIFPIAITKERFANQESNFHKIIHFPTQLK